MIEAHLKQFNTLNELNRNLSQSIDVTNLSHRNEHSRVTGPSPSNSEHLDTGGSRETMTKASMKSPEAKGNLGTGRKKENVNIIPLTRAYFERFFSIKQSIFEKEQRIRIKEQIKSQPKNVMADVLFQKHVKYVYNLKPYNGTPRIMLFMGEAGKLI